MKCKICNKNISSTNQVFKIVPCYIKDVFLEQVEYNPSENSYFIHQECIYAKECDRVQTEDHEIQRTEILELLNV